MVGASFLLRERRRRIPLFVAASAFGVAVAFVVLPQLDRLTQGTLVARFESVNMSRRDEIARDDLEAFLAHPVGGLGPGGRFVSEGRWEVAHTELTRLLAEHGLLGVAALLVLFTMAFQRLQAARTVQEKAFVAALLAWSFITMSHAAMRIVAPSLVFGLASAVQGSGLTRREAPARMAP